MIPGFWGHSQFDFSAHYLVTTALQGLASARNLPQAKLAFGPLLTVGDSTRFVPANAEQGVLSSFIVNDADKLAVFVNGVSSASMVPSIIEAYQSGRGGRWGIGETPAIDSAMDAVWNAATDWIGSAKRMQLYGHSLGGSVCMALGTYFSPSKPLGVWVFSYGAPRTGNESFCKRADTSTWNFRFHTIGDIVPTLPPWYSEYPAISLIQGYLAMRNFSHWSNPTHGVLLDTGTKTWRWQELQEYDQYAVANSLNAFATNGMLSNPPHFLSTYQGWFLANPTPPAAAQRPPDEKFTKAPPLNSTERQRINEVGSGLIRVEAQRHEGIFDNTVISSIPGGDPTRYRARRAGDMWLVVLGEDVVNASVSKRTAKSLARNYNRLAKAMATVDNLELQLQ